MKNKVDIDVVNNITLLLQIVLVIYVVTFGVISLFERELFLICELLIGLLMFIIAFNNYRIYKRKYMTFVYFGLGLVIILTSIFY